MILEGFNTNIPSLASMLNASPSTMAHDALHTEFSRSQYRLACSLHAVLHAHEHVARDITRSETSKSKLG